MKSWDDEHPFISVSDNAYIDKFNIFIVSIELIGATVSLSFPCCSIASFSHLSIFSEMFHRLQTKKALKKKLIWIRILSVFESTGRVQICLIEIRENEVLL